MSVSNQTSKVRYDGDNTTTDFDFSFKVFSETDIEVYLIDTSTDPDTSVLQTITTDYTVTLNSVSEGGTVTMNSAPASTDDLLIVRVLEYTQPTEIPTESNIPETQLENTYDKNTLLIQQVKEITDRSAKVSQTSEAVVTLPDPEDGKAVVWDGTSGTMVNSTNVFNDIVTDSEAAQAAAEAAQSAAETAQINAETAESNAEDWATKTNGIVESTDFSAKAWSIGGTDVTETASRGAAKEWATKTDNPVDTSEYSSKEWAQGTQTRGASGGGSSKDWANYTGGTVDNTEFSAKQYAANAAASATEAANASAASLWVDVVYVTNADSPVSISDSDSGKLYSIDTSGGAVVVNLPAISGLTLDAPWSVGFKKTTSDSNNLTINRNGTDTIDGSTSLTISRLNTGKNLIPDTDGTPDNWTSISFNEVPVTGDIVGTTDTQTLTNKTFDDEIVLQELSTTPSTPASGYKAIYPKDDGNLYTLDDAGNEIEVGSGGAGDADTIHLIEAGNLTALSEIDLTGNNADFDGGGTITASSLSLSETANDLIKSEKVIKYVPAADGSDDYFGFTKTIPRGLRGAEIGFSFEYRTDSTTADDDFRFSVKQKDGTNAGDIEYFNLEAASNGNGNSTRFSGASYITEDCTEVEFGFQNTSTTTTLELYVDNILVSSSPFVYKNLYDVDTAHYQEAAGYGSTNTGIPYFTNAVEDSSGKVVTIGNDSTNGFSITALRDCEVVMTYSRYGSAPTETGISLNASQLNVTISQLTDDTERVAYTRNTTLQGASVAAAVKLSAGDILRPHADGIAEGDSGERSHVTFIARAETEHVVTPAKSNANTFTAEFDQPSTILRQGGKNELGQNAVASLTRNSTGNYTVNFTTDFFSEAPIVIAQASQGADVITEVSSISTSSATVVTQNHNSAALQDSDFNIVIHRINNDVKESSFLTAVPVDDTIIVSDVKSSGVDGGTFTSGSYQTRTLNTLERGASFGSLSSNQITLPKGRYYINGYAVASAVNKHKAILYDVTNTQTAIAGSNAVAGSTDNTTSNSLIDGFVDIASTTVFELRHRCNTTNSGDGFGQSTGYGDDEIYSRLVIKKIK